MNTLGKLCAACALFLGCLAITGTAQASEIDILVQKLVEKRVLSPGEAQQILTETKEELRRQVAAGESDSLPKWVQTMKFKGDLRVRFQWEEKDTSSTAERERGRIRMRLGTEAKVNDDWGVAVGIASGEPASDHEIDSDPRSTNQTFKNTFSEKYLWLDYAYASWDPVDWFSMEAGKIKGKKTMWRVSDLLWDGDINPEGVSAHFNHTMDNVSLFANAGWFLLDESSSGADPHMHYIQPGFSWKFMDNLKLKGAVNYYGFNVMKDEPQVDWAAGTNTLSSGNYMYDYDSYGCTLELSAKEPFGGIVESAAVFGDYHYNPDPDDENMAWLAGFKFGSKKVKKFGDWQFKYQYRHLEQDAWVDFLPDSDALGGGTDMEGRELIFNYGIGKNTALGLDYYHSEEIVPHSTYTTEQDIVQADCVWKF